MKMLKQLELLAEKKKHPLKKGHKVKNTQTGHMGVVTGPGFIGNSIFWLPVLSHAAGPHQSCWPDHDCVGTDHAGNPVPSGTAPAMDSTPASSAAAPVGDGGEGGAAPAAS